MLNSEEESRLPVWSFLTACSSFCYIIISAEKADATI
jgi:hypothetical protein